MRARRIQHGAALLMAMLTVTLVATFAAAAMWQQWRGVEVEQAERDRVQSAWILTGALDWARLILREDAKGGGPDYLSEPWAVPLEEARLSTFLAAEKGVAVASSGDDAIDAFLSGQIVDLQSLLNVNNLVDKGQVSEAGLRAFSRLFALLGLPPAQLATLAENLRFASDTSAANRSSPMASLLPQRVEQLVWLGLPPDTVAVLQPYVTVLAAPTATQTGEPARACGCSAKCSASGSSSRRSSSSPSSTARRRGDAAVTPLGRSTWCQDSAASGAIATTSAAAPAGRGSRAAGALAWSPTLRPSGLSR